MSSQNQNKKFDLAKLQKNYFDATVSNVLEANSAIKAAQNWLLVLGLAEMSFLGASLLKDDVPIACVKVVLSALLISFVLFIIGSIKQYRHILSSARYYEDLSNKVLSEIDISGQYTDDISREMQVDKKQIKSDKITNILLFSSSTIILASTLTIAILIFYI